MKTLDLFCGCGGMSLGFQNAGFEVKAAFDHWKPALETYKLNFHHPAFLEDLSTPVTKQYLEKFSVFKPEMIIGGPPCQDFSSAGKRNENLGRADLTLSFAEIVCGLLPHWFVMENVDLVVKSRAFQSAKEVFKSSGYGLTQVVLNASFCGVPQNRKRLFLIGELNGADDALREMLENGLSDKPMTVHDYLGNDLNLEFYYRHPRSYARRAIFSIHEPSPTIRGVNRPIPSTYKLHEGDPVQLLEGVRPLTTLERARLQTFPEEFIFLGTKASLEQQIGNAVPVNLAAYVAGCILEFAKRSVQTPVQEPLFSQSIAAHD